MKHFILILFFTFFSVGCSSLTPNSMKVLDAIKNKDQKNLSSYFDKKLSKSLDSKIIIDALKKIEKRFGKLKSIELKNKVSNEYFFQISIR